MKNITVNDVAKQANVSAGIVRYYSRIGLVKPKKNRINGYKLFDSRDVSRIIFIRKAKSLGYTLSEIRKILSHATAGKTPCPIVRQIIERRFEENRRHINYMLSLQAIMEKAVKQWNSLPDGVPNRDTVNVLIESFGHDG